MLGGTVYPPGTAGSVGYEKSKHDYCMRYCKWQLISYRMADDANCYCNSHMIRPYTMYETSLNG